MNKKKKNKIERDLIIFDGGKVTYIKEKNMEYVIALSGKDGIIIDGKGIRDLRT